MATCNVIYEMPNKQRGEIINCSIWNIRKEIAKKNNQIPYDNIILVDKNDSVFSASLALYQTKYIEEDLFYKVYDAEKLYKELNELQINLKKKQEELSYAKKQINRQVDENQLQEQVYLERINQLSQNNIQINNIIKSAQEEKMRMTQDKEQQIKEIQNQYDQLVKELKEKIQLNNLQAKEITTKNGENADLYNQIYQLKQDINNLYQEKVDLQKQWQNSYQNTVTQYQTYHQYSLIEQAKAKQFEIDKLNDIIKNMEADVVEQQKKKNKKNSKKKEANKETELTIVQLQQQKSNLENEIKSLKKQKDDLEISIKETNNNVQIQCQKLLDQEKETQKLQINVKNLDKQIISLQEVLKQMDDQKQINNQKIQQLYEYLENSNEEIKGKDLELIDITSKFKKQKEEYNIIKSQKERIQEENQKQKDKIKELQDSLDKQVFEGQQKQGEIQRLSDFKNKNDVDLQKANEEFQKLKENQRELLISNSTKDMQISQLKFQLSIHQDNLNEKEQQLKMQLELFHKQSLDNIQQQKIQEQIIQKLSKRIKNYNQHDKINGLMDQIMKCQYKFQQCEEDLNAMFDVNECEIFEITIDYDKANQYLQNQLYFQLEECLIKNNKGNVIIKRSIQQNAESTFFKGFIIIINDATENEYKNKYLLRKELISQDQRYSNLDDAIEISKNNFLCQILMEHFNKILQAQGMQINQTSIARQFVLKRKDKQQYYYCEMLEEGECKKINGGIFQPQINDSYFNAFSKYVYHLSIQNYIITHIYTCGNYVYDMIVSTKYKGLFSPLDQGQTEIKKFLDIINRQQLNIINQHWNQEIEEIANKGFN